MRAEPNGSSNSSGMDDAASHLRPTANSPTHWHSWMKGLSDWYTRGSTGSGLEFALGRDCG